MTDLNDEGCNDSTCQILAFQAWVSTCDLISSYLGLTKWRSPVNNGIHSSKD